MPIIRRRVGYHADMNCAFLRAYRSDVTSQNGEDGIIEKVLDIIGTKNKWCVDVGAFDGYKYSNTYSLISCGWSSISIEGDSDIFRELQESLRAHGSGAANPVLINEYVTSSGPTSLDSILSEQSYLPVNFDLISIDIDGNDYSVWEGMEIYRPRVVVIEFNPSIPNDVIFIQDDDQELNQGSSLAAMIELGNEKGYELVATTAINAVFVERHQYPKFRIPDNSIHKMHDDSAYCHLFFQTYDGKIGLIGTDHTIWGKHPIERDDLENLDYAMTKLIKGE